MVPDRGTDANDTWLKFFHIQRVSVAPDKTKIFHQIAKACYGFIGEFRQPLNSNQPGNFLFREPRQYGLAVAMA